MPSELRGEVVCPEYTRICTDLAGLCMRGLPARNSPAGAGSALTALLKAQFGKGRRLFGLAGTQFVA